ncbi:hypothetical protein AXF42_Ash019749 [Apostasia shenzhenica]|uniref:Uncharacterized protein n=1 Tax=Apostasia shenzhenica TaxID=1088818 RepID=A0A2H9ZRT0_9ASPA|nr:hypothetical protein AXF42_Ash019749 [Apostasia shenzhenica]
MRRKKKKKSKMIRRQRDPPGVGVGRANEQASRSVSGRWDGQMRSSGSIIYVAYLPRTLALASSSLASSLSDDVTGDIRAMPIDRNDNSIAALLLQLNSVEKLLNALNSGVARMETRLDSYCNIYQRNEVTIDGVESSARLSHRRGRINSEVESSVRRAFVD